MARKYYVNYGCSPGTPRQRQLDALCRRLGLGTTHRDRIAAIDAAVSAALLMGVEKGKGEKDDGSALSRHSN